MLSNNPPLNLLSSAITHTNADLSIIFFLILESSWSSTYIPSTPIDAAPKNAISK